MAPALSAISDLLDQAAPIDAAATDAAARMAWEKVPAKMAVYLLEGAAGEPVLLATVGDLRGALKRRLADTPAEQRSKRVEYGRICTQVRYHIVHSPLAANWFYYRAAKLVFPRTYRELISWRDTHFVAVNPDETFPRFRRVEQVDDPASIYLGPIAERRAGDQLVSMLEDLFDLCRYYHILVQAPRGKACAYKEMGKCPAPCDGSVSLEQYRGQIRAALDYLTAPADAVRPRVGYERWRTQEEAAMKAAAGQLQFERAAKLKAKLDRGAILEQPQFSCCDRLERFAYLALQSGQGKPWVEPFFIHGGTITPGDPVKRKDLPKVAEGWLLRCREIAARPVRPPIAVGGYETMSLIAHHLFRGPDDAGTYLPMHYVTGVEQITQAAEALLNRKNPPKPMAEQSSDRQGEAAATLTTEGMAAEGAAPE